MTVKELCKIINESEFIKIYQHTPIDKWENIYTGNSEDIKEYIPNIMDCEVLEIGTTTIDNWEETTTYIELYI